MKLTLPDDLHFSDLALEREPVTRRLLFLPAPLGTLCVFNGLDPEEILASEDLSCELICEWYLAHRLADGELDAVAEAILAEVAELGAMASEYCFAKTGGIHLQCAWFVGLFVGEK